jgi:hypothetical protein
MSDTLVKQTLQRLLEERPNLHSTSEDDGARIPTAENWMIAPDVLQWIADNIPVGASTLETGCGYTTVLLAAMKARHTVIAPFGIEFEAIKRYCLDHGIPVDTVTYIERPSQDVVPTLPPDPVDLVIIDGDHAFPAPFIDWYYTAERVELGGRVIVDDTQLISCKILRDFLAMEVDRWAIEATMGKTTIFRRITSEPVVKGLWWGLQPFSRQPVEPERTFLEKVARKLRRAVGGK